MGMRGSKEENDRNNNECKIKREAKEAKAVAPTGLILFV
jgi:hypothetical protein